MTALGIGHPWPLGAHVDDDGVNFAVFSAHAQAVELCLFDESGRTELQRLPLPGHTQDVWHGHLRGAGPGLIYGLRAHGPWRPDRGHHFNPHKLLLDPYAREIVGRYEWRDEHWAGDRRHPQHPDTRDNGAFALKARVVGPLSSRPGVGHAPRPRVPLADTVLYELHVKGFTRLHPEVEPVARGTFAGLASDAAIAHLKRLGVTSLSLMPVHHHLDEERLVVQHGLVNYWGYNTIGFFAVDPGLAGGVPGLTPREEFAQAVGRLHREGFEVLLDVVYNHTAEGDERGPSISLRGLDHASYYRLEPGTGRCENHTGCGNTLDLRQPRVLQMVMDSLRYWATEFGIDGFRFDLAPVLGRGDQGFSATAAFFVAAAQDPVLSRLKLIAEPWDIGPGGYQVGGFPRGWLEWNDRFRDTMRSFWLGSVDGTGWPRHRAAHRGDFALRLCASSDLYQPRARAPGESVNYVTAHDGFTLADLLTYEEKRNHANGEGNRDGHGHNLGWNCGHEGPTDDPVVQALRQRLQRALIATTLLSQGTPMLAAGSELGHSQRGNNNAYCQDNAISWIDWTTADADLIAFTARVVGVRRAALPFGVRWYSGASDQLGLRDLTWLLPDGTPLADDAWRDSRSRALACLIGRPGRAQAPVLLMVNGDEHDRLFSLPAGVWHGLIDTHDARGRSTWHGQGEATLVVHARSLQLMAVAGADVNLPEDLDTP